MYRIIWNIFIGLLARHCLDPLDELFFKVLAVLRLDMKHPVDMMTATRGFYLPCVSGLPVPCLGPVTR